MAHELGHLLLHRVESITLAREDGDISPYKDPEGKRMHLQVNY